MLAIPRIDTRATPSAPVVEKAIDRPSGEISGCVPRANADDSDGAIWNRTIEGFAGSDRPAVHVAPPAAPTRFRAAPAASAVMRDARDQATGGADDTSSGASNSMRASPIA